MIEYVVLKVHGPGERLTVTMSVYPPSQDDPHYTVFSHEGDRSAGTEDTSDESVFYGLRLTDVLARAIKAELEEFTLDNEEED